MDLICSSGDSSRPGLQQRPLEARLDRTDPCRRHCAFGLTRTHFVHPPRYRETGKGKLEGLARRSNTVILLQDVNVVNEKGREIVACSWRARA